MKPAEVIRRIKDDGWVEILPRTGGSHRHFKHPTKPGKTTVPDHGNKDLNIKTLKSIERQSCVKLV